jgi:hypothetical protein
MNANENLKNKAIRFAAQLGFPMFSRGQCFHAASLLEHDRVREPV